jgi:ABC-type molybdate transport system ATPase subunit
MLRKILHAFERCWKDMEVVLVYHRRREVERLAQVAATQEVTVEAVEEAATVAHQKQAQCMLWCGWCL